MADLGGYDATQVKDSEFEALPAGEYRAVITESERKKTKDGTSELLQVKLQIVDGQYKNRTIIDRFNLWNKNPQATTIAQQQFKKVCEAVNVPKPGDSSALHMKPLMIKLSVREYNGTNQNEVKGYKACLSGASTQAVATSGAASKPGGW
jgi:hypothetical protein